MANERPADPLKTLTSPGGLNIPYYVIPFDKGGRCTGPATREHFLSELRAGAYTDVFVFSHGWNNDWTTATRRYEGFINGYFEMTRERGLEHPPGFKPLLVGIFWPSTALVFGESEEGPDFAAADGSDPTVLLDQQLVQAASELADEADLPRFYE